MNALALWPDPRALGPVTDLYELTMMAGYAAQGRDDEPAVFELFVRRMPPNRSYLVFAGLEQALADLARLAFSDEQVAYLERLPAFRHVAPAWFERLRAFRFTGDVHAVPEGSVVFAGEPLVRVEGPLAQAQLIETFLLASLSYPTLVASKAARCVQAARGRPLFDFGARRGHGIQAGLLCAHAAYLAGFQGTSLVEAARFLNIPAVGTMAHSWVQSFETERAAFEAYASLFPESTTLLVDTYDTHSGAATAARVPSARAIRLDSGDLAALARDCRTILNDAGRHDMTIFASGDLDEWKIEALVAQNAPIDAFGVGTELITSRDAPALSMVYKLVELAGKGRVKRAPGKITYPFAKQVWRHVSPDGTLPHDVVGLAGESLPGTPLLRPFLKAGQPVGEPPSLLSARERARTQLANLGARASALDGGLPYPVTLSPVLIERARAEGISDEP